MENNSMASAAYRMAIRGAVQTVPFFSGFAMITGYVMLLAALYRIADERSKTRALIGIVFTAAFAALIFSTTSARPPSCRLCLQTTVWNMIPS